MKTLVNELGALIQFPSVSNRPITELAAYLASRAEDQGFRVELFEDPDDATKCSVIARAGPDREGGGLTITGHMDVVPTEGQPWTSDPFRLREDNGRLYGRGTADMKGFIAATMAALDRIDVKDLASPLVLVWTHDEEVGCLGSSKLVEHYLATGAELPRSCLVGEPTGFQIQRMHSGHVAVEITVKGEAGHSSRPDLGRNAIEEAMRVVAEVGALAETLADVARDDLPELERRWVPFNVANIRGGTAINVIPDACTLQLGYRPLPGMPPLEPWERLQERLSRAEPPLTWNGRVLRITPSMLTHPGTVLQSHLEPHACTHQLGAAGFATDGGNLAKLGLHPLIFGPGSIDVAHKADEYVEVGDLTKAVGMVEDVIRALHHK